jgi:hypothetical protein
MLEIARLSDGTDYFELGFVVREAIPRVDDEARSSTPFGGIVAFEYKRNS